MSRRRDHDVGFTVVVIVFIVPLVALTFALALVVGYVAALAVTDVANTLSR